MSVEVLHVLPLPPSHFWLAVTVLVSFPTVAKHRDKRNLRKEGRAYFGDSLRHHEAIHILSGYFWDRGPAGLHIQMVKREKVPLTALPALGVRECGENVCERKTMASGT